MIGGGVSIAVVLVMACFLASQADAQTYEIVFTRFSNSNGVTLTCRLNGGDTFSGIASFFQNDTITMSITDAATESYTFIVDRLANEGQYTCGSTVSDSNSVNVIANPSFDHQVAFDGSITIRAKSGTTAVLPPYIRPGIWLSRYHIDWKNRTDTNEILVEAISGLRNTLINPGIERFSVDLNSFSLIIEKVTRTDAGNYFGELGVMETEGASKMNYMQTIDMGIRLEVYEEPKIIQQIQDVTMNCKENTSAQFTCTAKGFPAPTISWKHNGIPVLTSRVSVLNAPEDPTKYSVKEMAPNQDSEDTVTRILIIHNIHPVDSGSVKCVATVEPGGDIPPVKVSKIVVNFSVLKIFDVDVHQTVENKLIFIVDIGDDVMIPIGLRIQLDFKDGQEPLTTSEVYMNTNLLTFVYDDPPEILFTSIVFVTVVESRGSRSSLPMSKDLSMEINNECSINQQLITTVTPSALIIVCLLLFCISFVCCIKCWRDDRKDIREHNDRETIKLCTNLRKVLRKPTSNCDQKCAAIGHLINYVQQIDEDETIVNGTHNSPSSNTSSSRAGGPPPPTQQVDKSADNVRELSPYSSTGAVRYDNNNQEVSIRVSEDNGSNKIIAKGPSKKGRKNYKRKPYKKCTREEAIQKAKGLLS